MIDKKEKSNEKITYGYDLQLLLLSYMTSDSSAYSVSQNIIKPEYFDDKLRSSVKYIKEYTNEHNTLPTSAMIHAATSINVKPFENSSSHYDWYMSTIANFCKHKALEHLVLEGPDLLEKGFYGEIEKKSKEANTISLITDLGLDAFGGDALEVLNKLKNRNNIVPTGWKGMDKKLNGGFETGSLNIFAGQSGTGKSLFLQNIALNWALEGKNVIYITLELSEELSSQRIYAMATGLSTWELLRNVTESAIRIKQLKPKMGDLRIKKLSESGTTSNDIRAYLNEYMIKTGKKPDALVVDYLDLMHPNNARIDVSNLFTKDKYVSEELRSIASEWGFPVVTASQLNRTSIDASEFDHSHISGGISKINTADNVFAIYTSISMKERGEYQLQFIKTRSSDGVGKKISLKFNTTSLRISDADDIEAYEDENSTSASMEEFKKSLNYGSKSQGTVNMSDPKPVSGMSISQMAHPQGKSREQIIEETNFRDRPHLNDEKPEVKSSPLKDDLSALIARSRRE